MDFDTSRWNEPATRSELADVCIALTSALRQIVLAYYTLQSDPDSSVEDHIQNLSDTADELSRMFDALSGFISDEASDG